MFELIFVLIFVATLLVTGITFMTVLAATGIALAVMLVLGMMGVVFKLLPWLIVIALGIWFFKNCVHSSNQRRY
ncbi:envelope stress response protein PspG [Vibrio lentus]|uniref:Phage shock protein G n=1 Tax=Vibrio lentus TaxID=136468 RepID=A0AB36XIY6_9VIBR|nr:envelope stress response protein PspG [Vibrio lentus]MCC4837619.1 envelope stress response protein PspG [Vibrio lentus]PMI15763.1 phage shock protein G [Vibrio lentus]PMK31324.1 phage shock protein G [Vibrio lentus]PMK44703.1 phage shock protein G [Vibrio lentus]PML31774.1 phage shock protein G [Vibrio lentus]